MIYPELETPCVVVDLGVAERHVMQMQAVADKAGVKLRPHTKTHKSSYFANMQLAAGAKGVTVAKLGEAEVLAAAGIDDILIAFPLIGEQKMARLAALLPKLRRLIVSLDSFEVAAGLSSLGERLGSRIEVYAEVNTGLNRVGRTPGEDASAFCTGLGQFAGIRLAGVMSHAGLAATATTKDDVLHIVQNEIAELSHLKQLLGRPDLELSVGATPSARLVGHQMGVTELRPGTYIFMDRKSMGIGIASEADCAMRVLTTVVSHATADRAICDAGSKSLTSETHPDGGYGHVVGMSGIRVEKLSEEHGWLGVSASTELKVGQQLQIIPNHVCPAINQYDRVYGIRNGKVEREILIEGRGKNQ